MSDLTAINATAADAGRRATTYWQVVGSVEVEGLVVTVDWEPPLLDGVEADWGDGSPISYVSHGAEHTYATAGDWTILLDPYGTTPAYRIPVTTTAP